MIADSWIQLNQFRLQALHAAWTVDQKGAQGARTEIAGVKVATPTVVADISGRAMHLHGASGVSNEMPFDRMVMSGAILAVAGRPTEMHKTSLARALLKDDRTQCNGLAQSCISPVAPQRHESDSPACLERDQANLW